MAFNFNGNTPTKIIYNGNNVDKLVYNGVTVWQLTIPVITALSATVTEGWSTTYTETSRNTTYVPSDVPLVVEGYQDVWGNDHFGSTTNYIYNGNYTKVTITFHINESNSYTDERYVTAEAYINGARVFYRESNAYATTDNEWGYITHTFTVAPNSTIPITRITNYKGEQGASVRIAITSIILEQ